MYVMIIARGFPSAKNKSFGLFEFDQARALAAAGHKVVFAAADVRSIRRWRRWGMEHFTDSGIPVYVCSIPAGNIPSPVKRRITETALRALYARIVREHGRPDLMHAHYTDPASAAVRLRKRTGVPLAVTEHSSAIIRETIGKALYRKAYDAYHGADLLIAVSPSLCGIIRARFGSDPLFIPNMVDTTLFHPSAGPGGSAAADPAAAGEHAIADTRTSGTDVRPFRFVSVGNLLPVKRMDLAIRAFAACSPGMPGAILSVIGDGPERPGLEQLVRELGMEGRVMLMGRRPRPAVADLLRDSDCFILASQAETFGVAFIEALACGLPVIATRCGGPEAYVHSGNGMLVPPGDMAALSDAMKDMFLNKKRYNKSAIAEEAMERFSPEKIAALLGAAYAGIAGKSAESRTGDPLWKGPSSAEH